MTGLDKVAADVPGTAIPDCTVVVDVQMTAPDCRVAMLPESDACTIVAVEEVLTPVCRLALLTESDTSVAIFVVVFVAVEDAVAVDSAGCVPILAIPVMTGVTRIAVLVAVGVVIVLDTETAIASTPSLPMDTLRAESAPKSASFST